MPNHQLTVFKNNYNIDEYPKLQSTNLSFLVLPIVVILAYPNQNATNRSTYPYNNQFWCDSRHRLCNHAVANQFPFVVTPRQGGFRVNPFGATNIFVDSQSSTKTKGSKAPLCSTAIFGDFTNYYDAKHTTTTPPKSSAPFSDTDDSVIVNSRQWPNRRRR